MFLSRSVDNNDDIFKASTLTNSDQSQPEFNILQITILNNTIKNRYILMKLHRLYRNFKHSIRLFIEKDHKEAYIYFSTSTIAEEAKLSMPVLNLYGHLTSVKLINQDHCPSGDYMARVVHSSNQNISPDLEQYMSNFIDENETLPNVDSHNTYLLSSPELMIHNKPAFQPTSVYPALQSRFFLRGTKLPNEPRLVMNRHQLTGCTRTIWVGSSGPQTSEKLDDYVSEDLREEINRRIKERCFQSKNNDSDLSKQQNYSNIDFIQLPQKSPDHQSTGKGVKSKEWFRMILCKDAQFPVKLNSISGDPSFIKSAITDENSTSSFRLTLRLHFEKILIKHVQKIHVQAIFLAEPCSANLVINYDTSLQIMQLDYLAKYFKNLKAAGVKPLTEACSEKSDELLLALPLCEYSANLLNISDENWMTESDNKLIIAIITGN